MNQKPPHNPVTDPDKWPPTLFKPFFTPEMMVYLKEYGLAEMWPGGPIKSIYPLDMAALKKKKVI